MADLDDRLERAFRRAAMLPPRDPEGVASAIAQKRQRRRARRRAATAVAVATVVVTALATTAVIVARDTGGDGPDVVATGPTTPPTTPTSEQPPLPPSTASPEEVERVNAEVPAAAPSGYEVPPGEVTVVGSGEAVTTVTDTAGTTYEGVRFTEIESGEWVMAPASTCRIPGADPASCSSLTPEVRVTPGKTPLDPSAYAGAAARVEELTVDARQPYVRGPLLERDDLVWASAYPQVGSEHDFPPSELLAIDPATGAVVQEVDLQGEIMSVAADGDDVWALTRERSIDADQVAHRIKRIDARGVVDSMEIPPGSMPVGSIAAGGGRAWVPVRDGVLGFSARQPGPTWTVELPVQDERAVLVLDEAVYATSGTTIRRVDTGGRVPGELRLDTEATASLVDLVVAGDSVIALAADGQLLWLDRGLTTVEAIGAVPPGVVASRLHAAGNEVWATGTADLAPAGDDTAQSVAVEPVAVLLDDSGIEATLVIAGSEDADLAVLTTGELILTSGGNAYRVTLPEP